ncbi:MAG: ImmA/IrrE family metallo-endopeptidase [Dysgonamonadaceae bacterium]|jgi:Zn-dependent peptidase ImmA (M78 family)|nr:ImmA/IrrE family metallo-endopeptidase [Dysgonamonadaceae bacterium]
MIELQSKKDIEKISYEILKGSKSLDVFPTPIDKIVSYAELVVNSGIDLSKIQENYFSKKIDVLKRALGKVQGILDIREKIIYLDLSAHKSKQKFVKLHEVGHKVLIWQQKIYEAFEDDEDNIDANTREEFEAEANFFASATLFQQDRFLSEMDKFGLGIDEVLHLSKYFGASTHATLRRYVECSKKRCALIVLKECTSCGAKLRDKFQSASFTKTFGELSIPENIERVYPFVNDYCCKRKHKKDGLMSLPTKNGLVDFTYHFFDNSYNGFTLLFPVGEKKSTRTKIIINV